MATAKIIVAVWATALCVARLHGLAAFLDAAWHGILELQGQGFPYRDDTRTRSHTHPCSFHSGHDEGRSPNSINSITPQVSRLLGR
ncbi:hypothetical protein CGRA01v4_01939 [Colletotrichum graminicola]|nr:hypothetical protein CGRA01v4_01939 [Colletotrichum graminicola]